MDGKVSVLLTSSIDCIRPHHFPSQQFMFCPTRYPDEPAFVLPQCLKDMVAAGHLGRKSGRGFYHWDGEKRGDAVEGPLA